MTDGHEPSATHEARVILVVDDDAFRQDYFSEVLAEVALDNGLKTLGTYTKPASAAVLTDVLSRVAAL